MQKPEAFPPFWVYAVVFVSAVLYLGALVFWISAPWWFIHTTNPPPGAIELLHARGYTWATIYGAFAITLVFGSLFWLMAYLLYCTILREKGQAPLRPLLVGACLCFILLSMGGVGAVSYFMPRNTQYIVDNTAGVLSKEEHFLLRRSEVRMVKLDQIGHIEYQYHEGGTDATSPIVSTCLSFTPRTRQSPSPMLRGCHSYATKIVKGTARLLGCIGDSLGKFGLEDVAHGRVITRDAVAEGQRPSNHRGEPQPQASRASSFFARTRKDLSTNAKAAMGGATRHISRQAPPPARSRTGAM